MSNVKGPDNAAETDRFFEKLVEEHQTALLRTCYLYLKDQTLAEDAVQETFLKAYRSLSAFRRESSDRTWLMKIAVNTCRDMRRSGWFKWNDRRVTAEDLPEASVPFEEQEEDVVLAVMRLSIKMREVILLHYYQGMTTVEIADMLRISQSSVSGRLKRAKEKLKTMLERSVPHA